MNLCSVIDVLKLIKGKLEFFKVLNGFIINIYIIFIFFLLDLVYKDINSLYNIYNILLL